MGSQLGKSFYSPYYNATATVTVPTDCRLIRPRRSLLEDAKNCHVPTEPNSDTTSIRLSRGNPHNRPLVSGFLPILVAAGFFQPILRYCRLVLKVNSPSTSSKPHWYLGANPSEDRE